MRYEVSFGTLQPASRPAGAGKRFRLAVLGDFSGRANRGLLETGEALAKRKPIPVDVDTLDDVLARMRLDLHLELAPEAGDGEALTVQVPVGSMDDFHPDQLLENVALFEGLRQLRRDLSSAKGFARASAEVLSWSGEAALPPPPRRAAGVSVATDKRLSDFARLTGRAAPAARGDAEGSVEALMRRLVGPLVQPARDARQPELVARVDAALSAAMRRVLHHPDFQTAEALWRGVEMLVRRLETGARLQVVLYDVSAEELAADMAAGDALDRSGLYGMLAEQPATDADQGPLSAVIGLYGFELSPPHADLLGRVAQVAAAAGAPFVAGIEADGLQTPIHEQHPLVREAWEALHALPASAYLGLAAVRFLLRMPYGRRSDPIDGFAFEEFTREAGLSGMLWGHPALAVGLLLSRAWDKSGTRMQPAGGVIDDVPYYVYAAPDGEQVALPCTERLWSERQTVRAATHRVMPLVSLRGRPEVRLAGLGSLAGGVLAGFWAPVTMPAPGAPASAPAAAAPSQPGAPRAAPAAAEEAAAVAPEVPEAAVAEAADTVVEADDAAPVASGEDASAGEADVDLDALLASLSEPAPVAAEGETEVDLDALLASL